MTGKEIIKATIEAEQATAQLNQTLKSTGRYSEATSKALQDHATALQNVSTFSDDAIISAQSQLLTFTKLGSEVFPQATEAVLNLATKMKGDLQGAVVQIGKALNGHVSVEKRTIFGDDDDFDNLIGPANTAISFNKSQLAACRLAVDAWSHVGIRCGVVKDIRVLIGKLVWETRDLALYEI